MHPDPAKLTRLTLRREDENEERHREQRLNSQNEPTGRVVDE